MATAEMELLGRGIALAQLFALLCDVTSTFCSSMARSLFLAIRLLSQRTTNVRASDGGGDRAGKVEFFEGKVWHERRRPVVHLFEYDVRYALVDLDTPPSWFAASHHMTASEARSIAATAGPVYFSRLTSSSSLFTVHRMTLRSLRGLPCAEYSLHQMILVLITVDYLFGICSRLLTMPTSMGYEQNPLSVHYCYDEQGGVAQCIAEVTNTPWAERVTFLFAPGSDLVAKPLHVGPFMDVFYSLDVDERRQLFSSNFESQTCYTRSGSRGLNMDDATESGILDLLAGTTADLEGRVVHSSPEIC